MKAFSDLYHLLDSSTSTNNKVEAMAHYFKQAQEVDAAWASYVLAGGKLKQVVPTKLLQASVQKIVSIPDWLFEESYQAVGDLAETIAHLLPAPTQRTNLGLAQCLGTKILPLRGQDEATIVQALSDCWDSLAAQERFVFNKLLTGGLRVGVSKLLVQRALAQAFDLDAKALAQAFIGYTDAKQEPSTERFRKLLVPPSPSDNWHQPFPFFLAQSLQLPVEQIESKLGPVSDWQVEWKWDGIRAQLVIRQGKIALWSRGEELVTERFPEVVASAEPICGDTDSLVLDGELLVWNFEQNRPAGFQSMQHRLGRKTVSKAVLKDYPAVFLAYDLLEHKHRDLRDSPQRARRAMLEDVLPCTEKPSLDARLICWPLVEKPESWDALQALRQTSRERGVEGFMLKHRESTYGLGRTKQSERGEWWKWKIDPLTIDAVLLYAQAGHGRRASLYTDYTFALWDKGKLVPFAKAYSGLTDEEIRQVDARIRATTIEKFGPVRSVEPTLVFELAFEAVQKSARHKSGVAVRFPRMLRWRQDKKIEDANRLEDLLAFIE